MTAVTEERDIGRHLRCQLFGSVAELADMELQRATWLDPDLQNPHYSFPEFFECFYESAGGAYDEEDPGADRAPCRHLVDLGYISIRERDAVWPLHIALKNYQRPLNQWDHGAILNDPQWHEVCAVASAVRAALMMLLDDPSERECFENQLPTPAGKRWP